MIYICSIKKITTTCPSLREAYSNLNLPTLEKPVLPKLCIVYGIWLTKMYSRIVLNDVEKKVVNLLKKTADFIESKSSSSSSLEVRLAGGWVRDKLLGLSSDDLDVTLNKVTGVDFANSIFEYVHSLDSDSVIPYKDALGKLTVNPDQSKHLETATLSLFDLDIDFVGLRAESYDDKSRIPSVTPGTVETDALRRDFTVNTLFFNIRTEKIEDITKRGYKDLQTKVLVTPISPLQSFLEDPLRILRGIRFASRFEFTIDPSVVSAIQDPKVCKAFEKKVSKERVGEEIEKMLKGANAKLALQLLYSTNTYQFTFDTLPAEKEFQIPKALEATESLFQSLALTFPKLMKLSEDEKIGLWLYVALIPWSSQTVMVKKKQFYIPAIIAKDKLKLRSTYVNQLNQCCTFNPIFDELVNDTSTKNCSSIGSLIRQLNKSWEVVFLTSVIYSCCKTPAASVSNTFSSYKSLYDFIYDKNLQNAYNMKPLLDVCNSFISVNNIERIS